MTTINVNLHDFQAPSIDLVEERNKWRPEELRAIYGDRRLAACDFHVEGIESGEEVEGGYSWNGILNIDHHAPVRRMERWITSTSLACDHVNAHGPLGADWTVIINHTDADSILSSLILRGYLPPWTRFADAALAADHTGERNCVGDFLQAIQSLRDLTFSTTNLVNHLFDLPCDQGVQDCLDRRQADRERAKSLVDSGVFTRANRVAFAIVEEKLDPAFLPPLLPESEVILLFSPLKADKERWEVKARLGLSASEGLSLQRLRIQETLDPAFGGRWNAGSNKRGGGTLLDPAAYAEQLNRLLPPKVLRQSPSPPHLRPSK